MIYILFDDDISYKNEHFDKFSDEDIKYNL